MELTKCVVVLGLFSISLASPLTFYNETESLFKEWMKEHGKEYGSQDEYNYRIKVFAESLITIEQHNAGDHSYTLGLTPFADVTFEEFADQYLMQAPQHCSATHKGNHKRSIADPPPPDAVDWRKKGVVSKVKDQGHCGSCWTFSSTGALEAHMAIQTGEHLLLSEQQLVDCAQAFDNHGCKGGLPSHAFEYVHYNPGIMTEEDYPYKAKDGKCTFVKEKAKAFVKDIFNITEGDENELQEKVANKGPVSIAYQVVSDFRLYKKGVYTDSKKECKNGPMDVNHAVLAVGYDFTMSEYKQPYWIVKNSWGTKFGMEGYFYMEAKCNLCGMAVCNSYPDVYGV